MKQIFVAAAAVAAALTVAAPAAATATTNPAPAQPITGAPTFTGDVLRVSTGAPNATVLGNLTIVAPSADGHARIYPCTDAAEVPLTGAKRPNASVINYPTGRNTAAFVAARTDKNGDVCIYTPIPTHVVFDQAGVVPGGGTVDATRADAIGRAVFNALSTGDRALMTPQAAAGFVAGMQYVSGLDPNRFAGQTPFAQTNPRPNPTALPASLGLTQIKNPNMQRDMLNAADQARAAWDDPAFQISYLVYDLRYNHRNLLNDLQDEGPERAMELFLSQYRTGGTGYNELVGKAPNPSALLTRFTAAGTKSPMPTSVPKRVLDTRTTGTRVTPGAVVSFPATPGQVTYGTLTILDPRGAGHATVWPCSTPRPAVSNINFADSQTTANMFAAKAGTDGKLCVYSSNDVGIAVDVAGAGTGIVATAPTRRIDTRAGGAAPRKAGSVTVVQTGVKSRTVVGNITATGAAGPGHLAVWPCDTPRPTASSLNYEAGSSRANFVMARTAANGTLCVYTSAPTHIVFDQVGRSENVLVTSAARKLDTRTTQQVARNHLTMAHQHQANPEYFRPNLWASDNTHLFFNRSLGGGQRVEFAVAKPLGDSKEIDKVDMAVVFTDQMTYRMAREGATVNLVTSKGEPLIWLEIDDRIFLPASGTMRFDQWLVDPHIDNNVVRADFTYTLKTREMGSTITGRVAYNSTYRLPNDFPRAS